MKWPFGSRKVENEKEQPIKAAQSSNQEVSKKYIKEIEALEKRIRELELKISSMQSSCVTWSQFIIWIVIMGIAMVLIELFL